MKYTVTLTLCFTAVILVGCGQQAAPPAQPATVTTAPATSALPAALAVTPSTSATDGNGNDEMPASASAKAALKVFINCLKKADGKTLYDLFPPDVRKGVDQFYSENKSAFPTNIHNSVEFLSFLLKKAKADMPEDGHGYGFPALLADIIDEDIVSISDHGRMQGKTATFTTSEEEKLVFTSEKDGWLLGTSFADTIFEGLITTGDI